MKKAINGIRGICNSVASLLSLIFGVIFSVALVVAIWNADLNKKFANQPDYHKKILAEPYWSDQIGESTPYLPEYEKIYPERPKK